MRKRRGMPKLRARLTLLTTLMCVVALLVLGLALIYVQSRGARETTLSEIEYAMQSSNAAVRAEMAQITRVIRDLRNDPSFLPFWQGDGDGAIEAGAQLEYTADLYADANIVAGDKPFLTRVNVYREDDVIACAYYPTTQEESRLAERRLWALREDFIASGAEWHVVPEEGQLYLLTRLYGLKMEPLGVALFGVNRAAVTDLYQALRKYEGARYALRDASGALLAGEEGDGRAMLTHALALPFGLSAEAFVPEEQIVRLMRPSLVSMAVTLLLLLPVVALLASAIAYRFTKPLRVVADQIGRVEAGDYATKLELPGWEEFQDIGARFNAMTDTIRHLIIEVYEKQLLAKESEIKFLQSQMNPHFMYNVLTMIAITAKRNGDEEAYQLLHSFSSLSRGRVFTGSRLMIPLGQELELVNYYLFLQCKRYEDRITYRIRCDDALKAIEVPRLCIEPIAENAFLHGMEPKGEGSVEINVEKTEDTLVVTVRDNGVGFRAEDRPEGVGISNTRKILQNVFGAQYGVTVRSEPGVGTTAVVTLPAQMPGKGGDATCGA